MEDNLKAVKTTFIMKGSTNNKLNKIHENLLKNHEVYITKTALINTALTVFLEEIAEDKDKITRYLIKYNEL